MATSGTTTFNLDLIDIIEDAYEMVGIEVRAGYDMRTARRSLDLLMKEWANRGVNFWTIKQSSAAISAGSQTVALDSDTIDVIEAVWRTGSGLSQQDRSMTRMSVGEWSTIANKNTVSLPSRYWINRIDPPTITIWPVPVDSGTLIYWKLRRIEDTGAYTKNMDVPWRFMPAMISGLAYYLAIKTPAAAERIPFLQSEYERQFGLASDEDRERASMWLVPGID